MGDGGRGATRFCFCPRCDPPTHRPWAGLGRAATLGRPAAASQTAVLIGVDLRSTQRGRLRVNFFSHSSEGGVGDGGRAARRLGSFLPPGATRMAGIPMFLCRFARLWFCSFFVRRRVFLARMGEQKTVAFFSPKTSFFLAQKTGFCAAGGGCAARAALFGSTFLLLPALSKRENSRHGESNPSPTTGRGLAMMMS